MSRRSTIHIERKSHDAQQAAKVLRKAMVKAGTLKLNAAEASSLSGLPIERCEEALFHLAKAFPARVQVTESGTLYFGFARLRREAPPQGWRALWATFQRNRSLAMRVGTFTLGPFLLFSIAYNAFALPSAVFSELIAWDFAVTLSVTLGITASLFALALLMYHPLIGLPILTAFSFLYSGGVDPLVQTAFLALIGFCWSFSLERGLRRALGGEVDSWLKLAERWARGFLYGPAPADALEDERRVTAAILAHDQVLTVRDLMLLFGWDKAEAEAQLPRLLVDYGGELVVTEEGALVLRFDAQPVDKERFERRVDLRPAFERQGPPRLWDCPPALGVFVLLTSVFLIWGIWAHPWLSLFPGPATWAWLHEKDPLLPIVQGLGAWPYLLAIAPMCLRLPLWLAELASYSRTQGRRDLLRVLAAGARGGPVRKLDQAALVRLGGDLDMARSASGTPWVTFPLLEAGEREAEALRLATRQPDRPDPVAFDTEG